MNGSRSTELTATEGVLFAMPLASIAAAGFIAAPLLEIYNSKGPLVGVGALAILAIPLFAGALMLSGAKSVLELVALRIGAAVAFFGLVVSPLSIRLALQNSEIRPRWLPMAICGAVIVTAYLFLWIKAERLRAEVT